MTHQAVCSPRGLVRGLTVLLAAVGTLFGAVSCGAPQYTYVADSPDNTYFKVPYGWHAVPSSALASVIQGSGPGTWLSAYAPDAHTASAANYSSFGVTKPFAFAEVIQLNSQASEALSVDALNDIFLPVTSTARQAATGQIPYTGFQLLGQSTLSLPQGVHGTHVTFEYTQGSSTDTFDQVALTNADDTVLYALLIHCTSACFSKNQNAINDVVSSFTVRSPL